MMTISKKKHKIKISKNISNIINPSREKRIKRNKFIEKFFK